MAIEVATCRMVSQVSSLFSILHVSLKVVFFCSPFPIFAAGLFQSSNVVSTEKLDVWRLLVVAGGVNTWIRPLVLYLPVDF